MRIDKIDWVAPTGITGLHPLGRIRGVRVGPSKTERSAAEVGTVDVVVKPLHSVFHARLMLGAVCDDAEVHVRQASNFSWFGFPDDTSPSSRFGGGGSGPVKHRKNPPPRPRWHPDEIDSITQTASSRDAAAAHRDRRRAAASRKVNVWGDDTTVLMCSIGGGGFRGRGGEVVSNEVVSNKAHVEMSVNENSGNNDSGSSGNNGKEGALDAFLENSTMSVDLSNLYRLSDPGQSSASNGEEDALSLRRAGSSLVASSTFFQEALRDLGDSPSASASGVSDELKHREAFKSFSKMVEDPGTVKKKTLGSKALQRARNWTPLSSSSVSGGRERLSSLDESADDQPERVEEAEPVGEASPTTVSSASASTSASTSTSTPSRVSPPPPPKVGV